MTSARYIGHVGGLAVALGIGAAIAGFAGTAYADDSTGSPTTAGSDAKPASPGGTAAGTVGGDTTAPSIPTTATTVNAGPTRPSGAETDTPTAADHTSGTGLSTTRTSASEPKSKTKTARESIAKELATKDASPKDASPKDASPKDASPKDASPKDASPENVVVEDAVVEDAVPEINIPKDVVRTGILVKDTVSKGKSKVIADVVTTPTLTLAATTSPESAAAATPTLADVLASIGREFARTFFNQTPTLTYTSSENTLQGDGSIKGNLHPVDPDSTVLTYTATNPLHGAVQINSDGTFTYTPTAGYTGPDAFDVTASDAIGNGFHIHGFQGLFNLFTFGIFGISGDTTTQRVTVGTLGYERTVLASGLGQPTDFRFLPDGRILVSDKTGALKIVANGQVVNRPVIVLPVNTDGEGGVDGFAIDPRFQTNGYIYVAYTTAARHERLSRFTVTGDVASPGSELVLMESNQTAAAFHHGGAVAFGSDGKLYWGVGDNFNRANAQDPTNIHGKVLRINSDGTVPTDNPFVGTAGYLPQIYASGFRNPYRFGITPGGKFLVADVGEASWEEVNLLSAGANYGWPSQEGACGSCGFTNPSYAYAHAGGGAAISSVLVYTGTTFDPSYQNTVFFADFIKGWINVVSCNANYSSCGSATTFDGQAGGTVQLIQGPDGNIYQLTYTGELSRISPAGGGGVPIPTAL